MKFNIKILFLAVVVVLSFQALTESAEQILPQNISSSWNELTGTLTEAFEKRDMPVKITPKDKKNLEKQEELLRKSVGTPSFDKELSEWVNGFEVDSKEENAKIEKLEKEEKRLLEGRNYAPESSWFFTTRADIDAQIDKVRGEIASSKTKRNRIEQAILRELETTLKPDDTKDLYNARYKKDFAELDKQIQENIATLEKENENLRENTINKLLDKAIIILISEEAKNFRHETEKVKQTLRNQQRELDALKNQQLSARGRDLNKITARISELENQISLTKQYIKDSKQKIVVSLEKTNVNLTPSQWEHIFTFITGGDYLQNATVFTNVKSVMTQLADLMRTSQGNLEIENRYLGIRIVLYDLLIYIYKDFVTKIDEKYMPQLDKILTDAEGTYKLTLDSEKRYSTERNKKAAQRAVETTEKTLKAAKLYVEVLKRQRESAEKTLVMLREDRDFQELYYQVEQTASAVIFLIETGLEHFDSIQKLSIPELEILDDNTIADELDKISEQLQSMTISN